MVAVLIIMGVALIGAWLVLAWLTKKQQEGLNIWKDQIAINDDQIEINELLEARLKIQEKEVEYLLKMYANLLTKTGELHERSHILESTLNDFTTRIIPKFIVGD